jgi:hypothetical protein
MRRSTEKVIAVQLLTVLVAVMALLVAQLLRDPHRGPAPGHVLSWRGISVGSASPWRSLRRLIHHEFWAGSNQPVAATAGISPPESDENPHAQ